MPTKDKAFPLPYEPGCTGDCEEARHRKETEEWLRRCKEDTKSPSVVPRHERKHESR